MSVKGLDGSLAHLLGEWDAVTASVDVLSDYGTIAVRAPSFDAPHFALVLAGEVTTLEDVAALVRWQRLIEEGLRRSGHHGVRTYVRGRALIVSGADLHHDVPSVTQTVFAILAGALPIDRQHSAAPAIGSVGSKADSILLSHLYGPTEPIQSLLRLASPPISPSAMRLSAESLTLVYVGGRAPTLSELAISRPPARSDPDRSRVDSASSRPWKRRVRMPVPASGRIPILLGARLPGNSTPEAEAVAQLVITLLGGNACAGLWRSLRDELGLVYSPYASIYRTPAGSHWRIALDAEFRALPTVLTATQQQIDQLRCTQPATSEIDCARGFLAGSWLSQTNGNKRLCAMLTHWLADGGSIPELSARPHIVAEIGPEALRTAAESLLDPGRTCTVLGVPDDTWDGSAKHAREGRPS
ncbi:insulinase family protein [Streptomyces sp. NPDC059445]|uniref:insulinase family protein n=1 Tax=Streptomyces sp. NPDC059445 TaxID=3346832 RepID=UPI0036A2217B